ncbi:efflux transporter outer membrane subunit [Cyclobacteriaceae bacterium YHN15]|jgi:outer membrane protein, multidrug efflux system|nr:efflux transporter outer membrane subunit [Cyclobacteriaceae bacterium YHN15]
MEKIFTKKAIINLAFAVLILQGCKTSKISRSPENLQIPESFESTQEEAENSVALLHWEEFFEDDILKNLICIALENNQDNLKTLERIKIARANYRIAKAGWLPEISGIAGASERRFSEFTMDGVGNADANLSPNVPEDKRIPDPYLDFIVGAGFNWELDVWGKYKNLRKAASARYLASEEMANHVKTWLISEIAVGYYRLIGLDEEIRILEEYIGLQESAFDLSKDLKTSGKENQLAVDQFEALLLNSKSLFVEKQMELRSTELYLTSLLGIYQLDHKRTSLEDALEIPELIRVGLPSELLVYRPDIRIAERELLASHADVKAARAAFFPSFNLFGMAGFNAFDFGKLFFNPASAVYQFGAGLAAPVFNRNQIKMGFETANAAQQIAWYDYEQTVLKSYLEVLDLVNQFEAYQMQVQLKTNEVSVQKRSVDNSNTMFLVGYANYLEVINAQSRALLAEIELVELKTQKLQTNVKLYKALGGGWI